MLTIPHMATKLGLIDEGEPRHGKLRNLINRGFSPRMVKKLEIVFREITTEAIDAVAKNSSTSMYGSIVSLSESPLKEGRLYIGTDDGLIQTTDDGGA